MSKETKRNPIGFVVAVVIVTGLGWAALRAFGGSGDVKDEHTGAPSATTASGDPTASSSSSSSSSGGTSSGGGDPTATAATAPSGAGSVAMVMEGVAGRPRALVTAILSGDAALVDGVIVKPGVQLEPRDFAHLAAVLRRQRVLLVVPRPGGQLGTEVLFEARQAFVEPPTAEA